MLRVVAAAVLGERGLLLVAKRAAPEVFQLPGGKPEAGEGDEAALARELAAELGAAPVLPQPLMVVRAPAAHEGVPMELVVHRADLDAEPVAAAEIAALAWWPERTDLRLAPAVRDVVIPRLRAMGLLDGPNGTEIRRVPAMSTAPLRAAVLRKGGPVETAVRPDDEAPDTAFWAVVAADGTYESTVHVLPAAPPWDPDGAGWWQLRGMASLAEARGRGHGAALVAAVSAHVDERGGRLWCNARTPAVGLYARGGYLPVGAPWEHPEHGPHQCMARSV